MKINIIIIFVIIKLEGGGIGLHESSCLLIKLRFYRSINVNNDIILHSEAYLVGNVSPGNRNIHQPTC